MTETTHHSAVVSSTQGTWERHERAIPPATSPPYSAKGSYPRKILYEESSGTKNPRWKQQVKSGTQAGTPFSGFRQELKYVTGGFIQQDISGKTKDFSWSNYIYNPISVSSVNALSISAVQNQALTLAHAKIARALTQLQTLVLAGEIAESIRLVNSRSRDLYNLTHDYLNSIKKIRRKLKQSRSEVVKILADLWLEYAFGWRPIVNDVTSLLDAASGVPPAYKTIRAIYADTVSDGYIYGPSIAPTFPNVRYHIRNIADVECRYLVGLSMPHTVNRVAKNFGILPDDFLPSVYELIPFSFVVDYFTNVQEIIGAASFVKSRIGWVIKTDRRRISQKGISTPLFSVGATNTIHVPGTFRVETTTVTRTPLDELDVPSLDFDIPGLSTKWLNLSALVLAHTEARQSVNRLF